MVNEENLRSIFMTVDEFNALTDETLTDGKLADLRYIGAPPPPNVSAVKWAKSLKEKELTPVQKKIIHLAAMGRSIGFIADDTGLNYYTVRKFLAEPEAKTRIAHKQELLYQHDAKGYIKTLMNKAYGTVEEILSDDTGEVKASVRLEAAKFVIDHVSGKASQTLEVKGNLLGDLMTELDQMKNVGPAILATPIEPAYVAVEVEQNVVEETTEIAKASLAPMKDEMDDLVNQLVPDEFTVGKRG